MMDWGAKLYENSEDDILMVYTKDNVGSWKNSSKNTNGEPDRNLGHTSMGLGEELSSR